MRDPAGASEHRSGQQSSAAQRRTSRNLNRRELSPRRSGPLDQVPALLPALESAATNGAASSEPDRPGRRATARGFGVDVAYRTRTPVPDVGHRHLPSVEPLAETCDALVATVAGGPDTRGLVSGEVLDALGPRDYLANVARGSVVDEPALVAAVQASRMGAALDVFTDEPDAPRALLESDRAARPPHIAGATRETRA
ncbi:NAD(P)-dependent oxidoreductase [Streptomyces sp. NPDC058676]|uniref:NAD(P)-dependent oxidoreductase n=1 Tax=unclassified Streptomyces TaxID=2593676 RepID=UPI003655D60F